MRIISTLLFLIAFVSIGFTMEYHVSPEGNDAYKGTAAKPLRTISAAANLTQPGDVVTVHEGIYRESINPPRGGESDTDRIIYQAAPGEKVVIKGSEIIKGWEKSENDAWKVTIPNSFFGSFNPYSDLIHGDWFNGKGRNHHTGAVYLNEHWLVESARLEDVLRPAGDTSENRQYLLNVAWIQVGEKLRIDAANFSAQQDVQTADCSEGGKCIGWIQSGDWVCFKGIDFGQGVEKLVIRAASATRGGRIEIRLDSPDGSLLGTCTIPNTGGWQTWSTFDVKIKPTRENQTLYMVFRPLQSNPADSLLWFCKVDDKNTTIWAQFQGINPNAGQVEINVRRSVFYPDKPGRNYITVRGFSMMHAATPWAPPTAEQIGLIGTHWSKGWVIEDNDIRYSTCAGITLGKHGDEYDNKSMSAKGYVETIKRSLARGWSKENIGGHIVRNNHIAHCEQGGIVGSMGAAFCTITDNEIHDIHIRQLFGGAEMAGIKFHGAIDTRIAHNHIYRCCQGIWLDWMAQGTRVTRNLLHDNNTFQDIFLEVNHGPFLIDNNVLLSPVALWDMSEGGAFVHNLFGGMLNVRPELSRDTPYHPAHGTEIAGLSNIQGGDDRFYNNIFAGCNGLSSYDKAVHPMQMAGNIFLMGAAAAGAEQGALVLPEYNPELKLVEEDDGFYLHIRLDTSWNNKQKRPLVTTSLLGKAKIPDLPYVQPDDSPCLLDMDFFGTKRDENNPAAGPFEKIDKDQPAYKVWSKVGKSLVDCKF